MARVVQQQKSNPPYLLILFVFLFLVATVVAVLMYLDSDKAKLEAKRLADQKTSLVGNLMDTPPVLAMIEKSRAEAEHPSVVAQLQQKVDLLTQLIAGDAQSTKAQPLAEQAYGLIGSRPGLASAVVDAYGKLAAQKEQIQKLEGEIATVKGDLAQKTKEIATLAGEREKERTDAAAKIGELDKKLTTLQEDRTKAEAALTAERDREVKGRDKQIAELNDKLTRANKKISDLEAVIAVGAKPGSGPLVPEISSLKANGKVLRATGPSETAAVYLDLGQKDRVRPGMMFSIYPSSGIPGDPNNYKAKVVVTSVDERSSQCRITLLRDRNNPVLPDDLVYNMFFERARTLKFVVVGLFDIYGTGIPSAQGAEEVKLLIQRYGGTVQDDVTTDTDYVVVGDEPAGSRAPAPGETAAPASPEVERIKAAYKKAVDDAGRARIPVLNVNRFLNLIGFDPSVTTGNK